MMRGSGRLLAGYSDIISPRYGKVTIRGGYWKRLHDRALALFYASLHSARIWSAAPFAPLHL